MKKSVIALLLIVALLTAGCGSTAAEPTETPAQTETPAVTETPAEPSAEPSPDGEAVSEMPSYISNQVTVTDVTEEFIQTTTDVNDAENYENTINYVPTEDTLVFDAQGNKLSISDVKAGDLLTVYTGAYTPAVLIMPPQYQAEIIIIEDPEAESPVFTCADTFVMKDEMLVGLGNTLALNMSEDVEVVDREGQTCEAELENMNLLVFYAESTKSIPAQTTPLKVVLLGQNEQALSNMNAQ